MGEYAEEHAERVSSGMTEAAEVVGDNPLAKDKATESCLSPAVKVRRSPSHIS